MTLGQSAVVNDLAALPLHDATLLNLAVDWKERVCTAEIRGALARNATSARLRWADMTHLEVPLQRPWGPSVSILEARGPLHGHYEIRMQSGDVISIAAGACTLEVA